jgi:hypothetical protein
MASWAAVLALTGFQYSAVEGSMSFAAREGTFFWSTGYAWGTCAQVAVEGGMRVTLDVLHGTLTLGRFSLDGVGEINWDVPKTVVGGEHVALHIAKSYSRKG